LARLLSHWLLLLLFPPSVRTINPVPWWCRYTPLSQLTPSDIQDAGISQEKKYSSKVLATSLRLVAAIPDLLERK
jgi:hypothetical protein